MFIPAYNEEAAIGKVLDEIKALQMDCRVVVIDNMSIDRTREIALGKGAMVLNERVKGKGRAIRSAFSLVSDDYCVMLDADYTYPAIYIPLILDALGRYDVVMCPRVRKARGSMTLMNAIGNKLLTKLANLLHGTHIRDLCTGMWGFRGDVPRRLGLTSEGFTLEADMLVNAIRMGCRIGEVPIDYRARVDGSKPKLKLSDGFKIGWFLLREISAVDYVFGWLSRIRIAFEGLFVWAKKGLPFVLLPGILMLVAWLMGCGRFAIAIIFSLGMILVMAEMFNYAIERLCNVVDTNMNREIKVVKDVCAGAVLVSGGVLIAVSLYIIL